MYVTAVKGDLILVLLKNIYNSNLVNRGKRLNKCLRYQ